MAQSAGYSKNSLKINPFWERASAEPPLEWSKWAAMLEMAVFAKDGIEIRNLLRPRPTLVEPAEPMYKLEIQGEKKKPRGAQSGETSWLGESRHKSPGERSIM